MRSPHELFEGEILLEGRIVDASNATLFGLISTADSSFPIVYKPIAGERPLWDFPDGNLASREVASYLVSVAGGLDRKSTRLNSSHVSESRMPSSA